MSESIILVFNRSLLTDILHKAEISELSWSGNNPLTWSWTSHLGIRFGDVWAACAVRRAGPSQWGAGHVEHLPRRAEVSLCVTPHVQVGWERFYRWDSSGGGRQARDVYGTAHAQQEEVWETQKQQQHHSFFLFDITGPGGILFYRITQKLLDGFQSNFVGRWRTLHIFGRSRNLSLMKLIILW